MKKILPMLVAAVALTAIPALARDAGDPVFPLDLNDKARAEILYQDWQRDLVVSGDEVDGDAEFAADVFMLRIHTAVGQYAFLDFDVGGLDPAGGDLAFYGGVGLRYLAYDSEKWRMSAFGQVHYAPDAEGRMPVEVEGQSGKAKASFDVLDADAGVLLALKQELGDQLTLMPYLGPALSIIRINGDAETPGGGEVDFDGEEDQVLGLIAGLALEMPGRNGIRFEAQIFDQVSISAAASIVF